jgi:hypothetical protein
VSVTGTPPMRYLWRKDGLLLPNAVAASYQIVGVSLTNAGTYVLSVTNDLGGVEATCSLRVYSPASCTLAVAEGIASVRFLTVPGQSYTLEESSTATGPWAPAASPWSGDGSTVMTNFPAGGTRFYRLRVD